MTTVLVTGGAGFIGHHLVQRLIADGATVRVLDNLRRGSFERTELAGATLIRGDIRSAADCLAAADGCDAIVHLAAQSNVIGSEDDPTYAFETNVSGTWQVYAAARARAVPHLVFASSREVYGDQEQIPVSETCPPRARNLYGSTKVAGEALLNAHISGSPGVSILRFANVIGTGDSGRVLPLWLQAARAGRPLVLFGGTQVLDFLPVDVAVEAIVRVLANRPLAEPVNVGSGIATPLTALAERIVQATSSLSPIEVQPARSAEVTRFCADTRRMRDLLGIEPPADPLAVISSMLGKGE